ncbi:MAG: helix-turn-helix transcriptional regulator [Rhodospirillales bacterium]|nr:helix-turn-helix transcriptional regulator [Rhodospirillales bacterium]
MVKRNQQTPNAAVEFDLAGWKQVIDPILGHRIKKLREKRGMELGSLAQKLGAPTLKLTEIEDGTVSADGALLLVLGQIFSVPLSYFYEDLSDMVKIVPAPKIRAGAGTSIGTRDLGRFMRIYIGLEDPRLRKSLLELAEAITSRSIN